MLQLVLYPFFVGSLNTMQSIYHIPRLTHTKPHSINYWVTCQTNDTCDNTPLFSLCVCVFGPTPTPPHRYLNTQPQWTEAACGSSTASKLCLNFEAGHVSACPRVAWSTQQWWLSKEEVNGTGKQEAPVRWLTMCLDTKRWIIWERSLTDKWLTYTCCRAIGVWSI